MKKYIFTLFQRVSFKNEYDYNIVVIIIIQYNVIKSKVKHINCKYNKIIILLDAPSVSKLVLEVGEFTLKDYIILTYIYEL